MHRRLFLLPGLLSLVVLTVVGLAGCSHYRLGTGSETTFRTIYVAPVESIALAPQARVIVGTKVREAFIRDGRLALAASADEADAILRITLKSYGREATVSKTQDAGLARKFSLTLQAEASLTAHDGKVLFSGRKLQAQREAYVDNGQLQSEYETLPYLADQLAQGATHAVLDTW